MIFGPSVDEKHETLIAKVGIVVVFVLVLVPPVLFSSSSSTSLRLHSFRRRHSCARVCTFVGVGRSSSSSRKHEYVSQSFFPCSQAFALFPPPGIFLCFWLFSCLVFWGFCICGVWRQRYPTLDCVMCASSVVSVFRSILRWWYSGVCWARSMFLFVFFFWLLWTVLWLASVPLCAVMFWEICARVCSYVFLSLPHSFLLKRKIWYPNCGELC
jgi:hypothetical protein